MSDYTVRTHKKKNFIRDNSNDKEKKNKLGKRDPVQLKIN